MTTIAVILSDDIPSGTMAQSDTRRSMSAMTGSALPRHQPQNRTILQALTDVLSWRTKMRNNETTIKLTTIMAQI